jgi:hypothetical protein
MRLNRSRTARFGKRNPNPEPSDKAAIVKHSQQATEPMSGRCNISNFLVTNQLVRETAINSMAIADRE